MTNNLFDTVRIGRHELPHRLVMAPMTRSRAEDGGLVTELTAEYYAQRAGAALIVTEGVQPSMRGQGYIQTPGLHTDEQIAAWRKVTDAVHAEGGVIFAQLMHAGRIGHPTLYPDGGLPEAPSAVASGGQLFSGAGMLDHPEPRELSLDDIARVIDEFTAAARNAVEAGFDGVELHGANGYLIQQFLSDNANRRTDAYGGSVENRIRFAVEVTQAVSDAIGGDRVGFRVSPGGTFNGITEENPEELYTALTKALAPYGLAYLHVTEVGDPAITDRIRRDWPAALILNPAGKPLEEAAEHAERALRDGRADAVAYGRLWLANPDAHERIRTGASFNTDDPDTYYGGDHRGYTDYAPLG
ncbi:N-ethylmaleimide reductase [Streptomyces sp. RB5]|uniref:N-ethylmaleimide reductase n=1 Tax=Streptomyces smaragdinus TaxID=2585196 RepID=A0A7K0CSU0_9ACTN|nr:alkene reductase [Streptomyces smaragdinus]MQY16521.1 N-ethylmaleimide reductase [Streptomyces smaragdinus]